MIIVVRFLPQSIIEGAFALAKKVKTNIMMRQSRFLKD